MYTHAAAHAGLRDRAGPVMGRGDAAEFLGRRCWRPGGRMGERRDSLWATAVLLGAICAATSAAEEWASLDNSWSSHSLAQSLGETEALCADDLAACDCPGCVDYRARLAGFDSMVVIADGSDPASKSSHVVLAQAPAPLQPPDRPLPTSMDQAEELAEILALTAPPGFAILGEAANPASPTVLAANGIPGASVVPAETASLLAPAETGTILRDAAQSNTVTLQRRNTVSYDPHVRGFRYAQILSRVAGVWSPVRQDLDSPISKLDPTLIEDIAVIPGPYAAQFGPAFSYIDVATALTPRYQNGSETHGRIGETYRENGVQQHGRATAYGGGSDWGFIGHYGSRTGSDYQSGNNTLIPSSYNNTSYLGQMGFDLTPDSNIEVRYDRLDQTDTEYALQFFDVEYLGNDSTGIRYVDANRNGFFSQIDVDAWYNRTRYHGDNKNPSKQPVVDRVRDALAQSFGTDLEDVFFFGSTFGNRMLTGGRWMGTIGSLDDVYSRVGFDYRYEDQFIEEDFFIDDVATPQNLAFSTNLPKSWMHDAGVFDELTIPVSSYWSTTVGARVDFVSSDARAADIRPTGTLVGDDLSQAETLYGFYLVNDVALTEVWGTRLGLGHAQRPPSLVERYADGVFLGLIQSGFSRVIGDPDLDKERLWQIDWGLSCDYDDFRARGTLFTSWVNDFATYSGNVINAPIGSRLLTSVSTPLASLTGFEMYGEGDMSDYLTLFSALNYVQGTDQTIDAPLWGIYPLFGRAGVRLHDANRGQTWGAELALRMVSGQDRAGLIRVTGDPAGSLVAIEQPTPGFSVLDLRSYYNFTRNVSLIGGVENLLDKNYLEHLDLRLAAAPAAALPATAAFSPGITFYAGLEITN